MYSTLTIASSIIFCYTKSSAIWLAEKLRETGREVALLHGNQTVEERERVSVDFRDGKHKVLITTNIFARGKNCTFY